MATYPVLSSFRRAVRRGHAVLVLLSLTGCRGSDALAPTAGLLLGELNGSAISVPAFAALQHQTGMPDSLILFANSSDMMVRVAVEYTGLGTYAIGPEQFELSVLVGGDVDTGRYRGSAPTTGQLVVTETTRSGAPFRAELSFDATHESGESPFGPSVQFRAGRLSASLQ